MTILRCVVVACLMMVLVGLATSAEAAPAASGISAEARNGQVWLRWQEADVPGGATFNVYLHDKPLSADTLDKARLVGHHIQPHSSANYWLDPAAWNPPAKVKDRPDPVGFIIKEGGKPIDPTGGLFVHTITADDPQPMFFAVTTVDAKGTEDRTVEAGGNSLADGVKGEVELILPIWTSTEPGKRAPGKGSCKGRVVVIALHGRGGTRHQTVRERARYIVFGDASQGWIEGLAWKFNAGFDKNIVTISPLDGMWVGRPVNESPDGRDRCPGINTWWFGCNEYIYDKDKMPRGRIVPYTEKRLLYLVRWATEYLGCDPNRVYIRGGSMGGSGTVSMVLHNPGAFAAAYAEVPVVSYTEKKCPTAAQTSAWRLYGLAGRMAARLKTADGTPLLQKMNGPAQLKKLEGALPPIYIVNGRTDRSIPWCNNPEFYRGLDEARQYHLVAWNNEGHGKAQRAAPKTLQDEWGFLSQFRLDRSYPAFTDFSINDNPGNGDPEDGDIVGYYNYGLSFKDVAETDTTWSVTLLADDRGKGYPVSVKVTPRRLQTLVLKPGDAVQATVDGQAQPVKVDEAGLVTVPVTIRSKDPVKLVIKK